MDDLKQEIKKAAENVGDYKTSERWVSSRGGTQALTSGLIRLSLPDRHDLCGSVIPNEDAVARPEIAG